MIVSGSGYRGLQRRLTPQEYHCGGKATYETEGGECKEVLGVFRALWALRMSGRPLQLEYDGLYDAMKNPQVTRDLQPLLYAHIMTQNRRNSRGANLRIRHDESVIRW